MSRTPQPESREVRLAVWDELDALDAAGEIEEGHNPLDGQEPTRELIEHMVPIVAPQAVGVHTRGAARARVGARERLRTWLSNADYYTPYIDLDVVRRARDFDLDAWENASGDERATVMDLWLSLIGDEPAGYVTNASFEAEANWNSLAQEDRDKIAKRIIAARERAAKRGARA